MYALSIVVIIAVVCFEPILICYIVMNQGWGHGVIFDNIRLKADDSKAK